MKKITVLFILLMSFVYVDYASANNEVVPLEKIWSITMNLEVLNTKENLNLIKVLDENKNELSVKVSISEDDKKTVEITPLNNYLPNKGYTILINSGVKSTNGLVLKENVEQSFITGVNVNVADISNTWKTTYETSAGVVYNITATFKDGTADITNINKFGDREYTIGVYSLYNSSLKMDIMNPLNTTAVLASLEGKLGWYNSKHFKITNKNGATAHFIKQ